MEVPELAAAYLKHYRSGADEDFWAFEDVITACNDLAQGFPLALKLIELAEGELELAYVAAGPVEDLLNWHGLKAFFQFEAEAKKSPKVRQALAGVWMDDAKEVYPAWKSLLEKYGLARLTSKPEFKRRRL